MSAVGRDSDAFQAYQERSKLMDEEFARIHPGTPRSYSFGRPTPAYSDFVLKYMLRETPHRTALTVDTNRGS